MAKSPFTTSTFKKLVKQYDKLCSLDEPNEELFNKFEANLIKYAASQKIDIENARHEVFEFGNMR